MKDWRMYIVSNFSLHWTPFPQYPFLSSARLTYLTLCTLIGLYVGFTSSPVQWVGIGLGGASGFIVASLALWMEFRLTACSRSLLFGGSLGLMGGLAGTSLLVLTWHLDFPGLPSFVPWGFVPSILLFPYLGLAIGLHFAQTEWNVLTPEPQENPTLHLPEAKTHSVPKLLDSSAIIDGRVMYL